MKQQLITKIKESLFSVLPITLIVILLDLTPLVDFTNKEIMVFIISAILLIIGISFFNLGADLAMTPMGKYVGSGLTKSKKIFVLIFICFLMGFFITVAEPDLTVLASQVKEVMNPTMLIMTVGFGVGLFLIISILKIVLPLGISFYTFQMISYLADIRRKEITAEKNILKLALYVNPELVFILLNLKNFSVSAFIKSIIISYYSLHTLLPQL